MTKANITRWYSPVGVMVLAGGMCERTVTFRLCQHTGGRGTRVALKAFANVMESPFLALG